MTGRGVPREVPLRPVSFRDASIVRAALRADAAVLLSEDLQDGRRFGPLEVRDPFRAGDAASGK